MPRHRHPVKATPVAAEGMFAPVQPPKVRKALAARAQRPSAAGTGGPRLKKDGTPYKPHRYRPGTRALMEIRKMQRSTSLLIPKLPFNRLVREIHNQIFGSSEAQRYQASAILALQEAAESFLITLMEKAYLGTIHARRVTLFPHDFALAKRIWFG